MCFKHNDRDVCIVCCRLQDFAVVLLVRLATWYTISLDILSIGAELYEDSYLNFNNIISILHCL